jgi:hypothetical protein
MTRRVLAIVSCVVLCSTTGASQEPTGQRLLVNVKDGVYELALPVSRLVVMIPQGQLVPSTSGQGPASPRYFSLEDRSAGLVVSGWFEPEQAFKGLDAFWAGEQRGLTQNGIRIENAVREKSGNWQTVLYDIVLPGGRSSNMRAEWVQSGTWIDVHLSLTTRRPEAENRDALRKVIEAIRVEER